MKTIALNEIEVRDLEEVLKLDKPKSVFHIEDQTSTINPTSVITFREKIRSLCKLSGIKYLFLGKNISENYQDEEGLDRDVISGTTRHLSCYDLGIISMGCSCCVNDQLRCIIYNMAKICGPKVNIMIPNIDEYLSDHFHKEDYLNNWYRNGLFNNENAVYKLPKNKILDIRKFLIK